MVHFYSMVKIFLSVLCLTFIWKFRVTISWCGVTQLFSSSVRSGPPNWLTIDYFISIHHCFHSKQNDYCIILHYTCSYKFFCAFTDPILLHIVIHQGIFCLSLLSYFKLPYCFLMGIRFSSSCVFIFYIVFTFLFCLLQTFVIRGIYLIEKKDIGQNPSRVW